MWPLLFSLALMLVAMPARGASLFVDPNNPDGYATIGEAIQQANDGDAIYVAEGFYTETITINKSIRLVGAGPDLTILSYGLEGNAINVQAGVDTTAVIEGFTITAKGGNGISIANEASATIRNCRVFRCNGTGIHLVGSQSIIRLNTISGNTQGAIYLENDRGSLITSNTIVENTGGATTTMYHWSAWDYQLSGVVLVAGAATQTVLANNLVANNTQERHYESGVESAGAAAIGVHAAGPAIRNNTIVDNDSSGVYLSDATALVTGNIIVNNTLFGIQNRASTPVITYNDVFNNASGNYGDVEPDIGDISRDPRFVDSTKGDYHLQDSSPCIDAGTSGAANFDPDGTRNDMGMFGGPFARFWRAPYTGPVITDLEVTPSRVQQGGTITVRASGTTVPQ